MSAAFGRSQSCLIYCTKTIEAIRNYLISKNMDQIKLMLIILQKTISYTRDSNWETSTSTLRSLGLMNFESLKVKVLYVSIAIAILCRKLFPLANYLPIKLTFCYSSTSSEIRTTIYLTRSKSVLTFPYNLSSRLAVYVIYPTLQAQFLELSPETTVRTTSPVRDPIRGQISKEIPRPGLLFTTCRPD